MEENRIVTPEIPAWRQKAEQIQKSLKGGGGGGTYDGMEARVKRLEDDTLEIRTDLKAIRADLAELKGKVSMLPGYAGLATLMAMIGGALLIVSRLFPGGPPAP